MVFGFTTTCAISAYHHSCCEFESRSGQGVQHYVTCYRSVVFPGPPVSSTNKTDRHGITELVLKVALNTIKQTNKSKSVYYKSTCQLMNMSNVKLYSIIFSHKSSNSFDEMNGFITRQPTGKHFVYIFNN